MTFASIPARWLGSLALSFLSCVGAQTLPAAPVAPAPAEVEVSTQPSTPQRFEQAWDVVELMGQPMLADAERPARLLLRPQGSLWVDGGCNYFSGRIERDAQGLFRVSKYGGTHSACEKPPRSEALLNSALMLVDGYRWDGGLVLRSGSSDVLRLQPSANQDSNDIEQGLAGRAAPAPAAAPAPVQQAAAQACRKVKAKSKTKGGRAVSTTQQVCKPVAAKAGKAGAKSGQSRASKSVSGKAKSAAKAKPVASNGKPKRPS